MKTAQIVTENGIMNFSFTPPVLLSQLLQQCGVRFDMPCGGKGSCRKCKITACGELSALTPDEGEYLTEQERAQNLRFACMAYATGDVTITLPKSGSEILTQADTSHIQLKPFGNKKGAAIDIGTTTVAAYLIDLESGNELAVSGAMNPQLSFGADVVSRLEASLAGRGDALAQSITQCISQLLHELCSRVSMSESSIDSLVITGNTAMLYFLTRRSVRSIAFAPFEQDCFFGYFTKARELGLHVCENATVYLPRCISAYVGADITTALIAAEFDTVSASKDTRRRLLADIGTNGEMAIISNGRLHCCSTAAGPAFEGAGLHSGMTAQNGAICAAEFREGTFAFTTIGSTSAKGICGSGIIDCIAAMLDAGLIDDTGRLLTDGHRFEQCICEHDGQPAFRLPGTSVLITQKDIRAVQLAKSAICAGILTLLHESDLNVGELDELCLAGGFGTRINISSAKKIGLIPSDLSCPTHSLGNAAGAGAIELLLNTDILKRSEEIAANATAANLTANSYFTEKYIDCMMFQTSV